MPKTAVVLHVFYEEAAQGPLSTLKKIEGEFDLFVTASKPLSPSLSEAIQQSGRKATLIERPGFGQDLALFLSLIPDLMEGGYQAVCKLHTKRDALTDLGERWRRIAANAVIGTSARFCEIQRLFEAEEKLAFAGPKSLYVSAEANMYESYGDVVEILRASYPNAAINSDWGFFAGSVFWAPTAARSTFARTGSAGLGRPSEMTNWGAFERAVGSSAVRRMRSA
jgi:lipopolysaccharide biosynthesis protein